MPEPCCAKAVKTEVCFLPPEDLGQGAWVRMGWGRCARFSVMWGTCRGGRPVRPNECTMVSVYCIPEGAGNAKKTSNVGG